MARNYWLFRNACCEQPKKTKLSFNEKREWEQLNIDIPNLEAEQKNWKNKCPAQITLQSRKQQNATIKFSQNWKKNICAGKNCQKELKYISS